MTEVQDPTVQRRRLRLELRKARDAAHLRQAAVARAMDWSPSKIIRIERGEVGISTNDLRALLNHYGVKDKLRVNEMLELARSARGASFYDQYTDLLKPGFAEYLAYESSASVVRQYDPVLVPGVLQIEEYARAMFTVAGPVDPSTADRGWAVRQHRQEILDRDDPPELLFVLDEAALRRHVGGANVMRHQLERLKDVATAPNVSMQIMPFSHGAHPGMSGNFILLEFSESDLDDLAHLESIDSITIRDDTDLLAQFLDRFEQLQKTALAPDESLDFFDVLISDLSLTNPSESSTTKEAV